MLLAREKCLITGLVLSQSICHVFSHKNNFIDFSVEKELFQWTKTFSLSNKLSAICSYLPSSGRNVYCFSLRKIQFWADKVIGFSNKMKGILIVMNRTSYREMFKLIFISTNLRVLFHTGKIFVLRRCVLKYYLQDPVKFSSKPFMHEYNFCLLKFPLYSNYRLLAELTDNLHTTLFDVEVWWS